MRVSYSPLDCSLRDLSPSLVEENRVCGSVSGGGVCYSGDSVGSVAVYFCDDGYTLEGDTTRECLSCGLRVYPVVLLYILRWLAATAVTFC